MVEAAELIAEMRAALGKILPMCGPFVGTLERDDERYAAIRLARAALARAKGGAINDGPDV